MSRLFQQIEQHLAAQSTGVRASTPSVAKQRGDASAAAAAAAASPLAPICEDDEEISSPDVNAKLEVGCMIKLLVEIAMKRLP